eukprot:TRINITY_DN9551_c0_g1_i1.p1 TRINITY_DN9551_c0_g1~~TRINITY_DN9551_c0_g1_i1.p1  ORF type:complete len:299 (-),score=103.10 TRINITY_DN9551_c0_g1_i1:103-999(-)
MQVKQVIEKARGNAVATTWLIYKGKVLGDDAATLAGLGIADGELVVMMTRAAPAVKAAEPAAAPKTAGLEAQPQPQPQPQQPQQTSATARPQQPRAEEQPRRSQPDETLVGTLCEMGFERSRVLQALRASHNNPNLAAQFLTQGFDASGTGAVVDYASGEEGESDEEDEEGDGGAEGGEGLEQQLANTLAGLQEADDVEMDMPELTTAEKTAVQRLMALGFDEAVATQAYIACDKNEEYAANWLLTHGTEFHASDVAPGTGDANIGSEDEDEDEDDDDEDDDFGGGGGAVGGPGGGFW